MRRSIICIVLAGTMAGGAFHEDASGQDTSMWMREIGAGWRIMGMAQAYPILTTAPGAPSGSAFEEQTEFYLTQPVAMLNLESPGSRVTLRTTLDFEGLTQEDGELTPGGWGEGFIDMRHPHTLVHELMLSVNAWEVAGGALSVSAGKGFAPFGTDDPMSRPPVKYPTNHHLSQILERWTVSGGYVHTGWSVEAGVFGGAEPTGPYDFGNIDSFADSWSARVARRYGRGGTPTEWELSASMAQVREEHGSGSLTTALYNAALRHERQRSTGSYYALLEASLTRPEEGTGMFAVLGEARLTAGRHQPYMRVEYARRPEYERKGAPGTNGFFRYDHDSHALGSTRWLISTVGYNAAMTQGLVRLLPFVEIQHSRVSPDDGDIDPRDLYGARGLWQFSAGVRIHLGGGPMRMGSYGVLDAMTVRHRPDASDGEHMHTGHNEH